MKKMFLINNPQVFHHEKLLKNHNNYFEGWYFKCSTNLNSIAFIPGINSCNNKKSAFIQVITNSNSYYIPYKFEDFSYSLKPFYINICDNFFSLEKISLNIADNDVNINGKLTFCNLLKLEPKFLCPNIMGPFSYIPFMECNHAILSMRHSIFGTLNFNDRLLSFDNGIGYSEKDFGISFPKSYVWCQANCFKNSNSSIFLSIANIPFKKFSFLGFICVANINGKEYRFTTYNGSKIEKLVINKDSISIILKRNFSRIFLNATMNRSFNLKSPKFGEMKNTILESIDSSITIKLEQKNHIIFSETSSNCGLEIVDAHSLSTLQDISIFN